MTTSKHFAVKNGEERSGKAIFTARIYYLSLLLVFTDCLYYSSFLRTERMGAESFQLRTRSLLLVFTTMTSFNIAAAVVKTSSKDEQQTLNSQYRPERSGEPT